MLIQITNNCNEMCPHCLQCSVPNGEHMQDTTFKKVLNFLRVFPVPAVVISGGEPTEHPKFLQYCTALDKMKVPFTVASNGMFITDYTRTRAVEAVAKLKYCMGIQIYTNPKWYRNYKLISSNNWSALHPKIQLTTEDIRSMQDLGRARESEAAQKEIDESPYFMSCLNGTLLAKQSTSLKHCAEQLSAQVRRTSMGLTNASMLCKPCVDYQGKIHMSESRLCPACGDLNTDTYIEIWDKMKNFTPCGRCKNFKRFESSTRSDIIAAKNIIYGNKQQD